jgi:hypothetical protein
MQFHTEYGTYILYTEYHSVCPLAGIGTRPTPFPQASVPPTPEPKGGGHTRLRVRGAWGESQFRRLEKKLSTLPALCNFNWDLRPAVLLPAAASAASLAQQRHVHLTLQVDDHVLLLLLLLLGQEELSSCGQEDRSSCQDAGRSLTLSYSSK